MYNDIICDHFMNPRNIGELSDSNYVVEIGNPVCGDTVHMYLKVENFSIIEVLYKAYGCSTSIATASIISERIKGKRIDSIAKFKRIDVESWLGELEPSQFHCIDIGLNILMECSNPKQVVLKDNDFLIEPEDIIYGK